MNIQMNEIHGIGICDTNQHVFIISNFFNLVIFVGEKNGKIVQI